MMAKRITSKASGGNGASAGASRVTLSPTENAVLLQTMSALQERTKIAGQLGQQYGGDRDLYTALGYKQTPDAKDYLAKYRRQDIARAVVSKPVQACWRKAPEITEGEPDETQFQREWKALVKRLRLWHYFARVDKIARLGEYAVLLLGFQSEASDLKEPVVRASEIAFVMPYGARIIEIKKFEDDVSSPRFGKPLEYSISMKAGAATTSKQVHWTRIIHVSEDNLENDTLGTPALESIFNRLQDLEKVAGGSAEMFWRGAFPGYAFKIAPDATIGTQDMPDLKDEIDDYIHGLKRTLRLQGIDVQSLEQQVADPSNHVDVLLTLISAATDIPMRILIGSERGELASSQDEANWLATVDTRRRQHCEPVIIRAFIDRCIEVGVLTTPVDGYDVAWADLLIKGDKELAEVGLLKAQSLKTYTEAGGGEGVLPVPMAQKKLLGMTDDEIEQAEELADADNLLANENEGEDE